MADPLNMLQAALTAEANSPAQADILIQLRNSLEATPAPIPILVSTLISNVSGWGDSLLRMWVVDLLCFGICTPSLHVDQRTQCEWLVCVRGGMGVLMYRSGDIDAVDAVAAVG